MGGAGGGEQIHKSHMFQFYTLALHLELTSTKNRHVSSQIGLNG